MKQISVVNTVLKLALVGVVALLLACSDSDNDSGSSSTDATISGTIVAAPVNGAEVNVVDGNGNVVVEAVKTNAAGQYTLTIPSGSLGQDLIVKSTGGTFTDEAKSLVGNAGEMLAYVQASTLSNGSSVSATPGSTIIAHLVMNHNKLLTQAEEAFANAFGYTPDISVEPANAADASAADASENAKLAGLRAAAFSQLAMDLGMLVKNVDNPTMIAEQFEMFAALAKDLSDEALDGVVKDGTGASEPEPVTLTINGVNTPLVIDIQNRFATALLNFHNNGFMDDKPGNDKTALTSAQIGALPFAKVSLIDNDTSAYKIKYVSDMMPMMGKTTFQFQITDLDGNNVSDAKPVVVPKMYMSEMAHSSPVTAVTYNGTEELYTATVYYLMASMMGYWDLKIDVDGNMLTEDDATYFYPSVMADITAKVEMSAVGDKNGDTFVDADDLAEGADLIKNMDETFSARTYIIFKEEVSDSAGSLSVFIAAKEHMMSFPAVLVPGSLELSMMGMPPAMAVNNVTVEMSSNAGGDWETAITNGEDGIWKASNLSLVAGKVNEVRVKLQVNGEAKVTNTGDDYQTLFVTP